MPGSLSRWTQRELHIGLVEATGNLVGRYRNLLYQTHLVGIYRSQPVQQIDLFSVGCRVPQNAQWFQGCDSFLGLWRVIHTLRLVDDNNGMGVLDVPHSAVAIELVLCLIDDVLRFLECVDINDHNLDVRTGSKLAHIGQFGGVVDKIPTRNIVILQTKMLLGHF